MSKAHSNAKILVGLSEGNASLTDDERHIVPTLDEQLKAMAVKVAIEHTDEIHSNIQDKIRVPVVIAAGIVLQQRQLVYHR